MVDVIENGIEVRDVEDFLLCSVETVTTDVILVSICYTEGRRGATSKNLL